MEFSKFWNSVNPVCWYYQLNCELQVWISNVILPAGEYLLIVVILGSYQHLPTTDHTELKYVEEHYLVPPTNPKETKIKGKYTNTINHLMVLVLVVINPDSSLLQFISNVPFFTLTLTVLDWNHLHLDLIVCDIQLILKQFAQLTPKL